MNKPKSLLITLIGGLMMVYAIHGEAHDQSGKLGPDPSATDYYIVTCFKDDNDNVEPALLEVSLMAYSKSPAIVSLQLASTNPKTIANITDPIGGDKSPSQSSKVANLDTNENGGGIYLITVDKSAAGTQSYQFKYHCKGQNGDHVGTQISTRQNQ